MLWKIPLKEWDLAGGGGGIRKERKARRNSEDVRGNGAMFGIFAGVP